ncbi:MAG: hypothetical protein FVQ85_20080 [Planctomycetes bacterium]|nr:hypothetical protein [Planctomycetota bacterium]
MKRKDRKLDQNRLIQKETKMPDKISVSTIMKTMVLIFAVLSGIYGSIRFIDSRIEKIVNDEQFIRKVASYVRPYITFDENESILIDGGAMQHLESIPKVSKKDKNYQIIITPKDYLAHAPLIETFGLSRYDILSKRGRGFQWIYDLHYLGRTVGVEEHPTICFRLEILR